MAKFYGAIGYSHTVESVTQPGVYEEQITERFYRGDILRNNRRFENSGYLNDNINVSNQISIVSDAYADQNFFAIRYVKWMGAAWKVSDVEVERPRLILTLGGVYNGPQIES